MPASARLGLGMEAAATGFFLGLLQVALGFALLSGAGASALRFFALTAAWLLGSLLGALSTSRGGAALGTALLVMALASAGAARAALSLAPFHDAPAAAGFLAGALAGSYAGRFLGERAPAWGEARALLLYENNGFIAGFAAASLLLFVSARALDAAVGGLGLALAAARVLQRGGAR